MKNIVRLKSILVLEKTQKYFLDWLIVFVHCVHLDIVYHKFHHIYIHLYICENKFIKWNGICNWINYFGNVIVI